MISGEDGRSRAEQLLHILRRIDPFVASSVEHQRRRGCAAAHELLLKFRVLCSSGNCGLGCHAGCPHRKIDRTLIRSSSNLPGKEYSYGFLLIIFLLILFYYLLFIYFLSPIYAICSYLPPAKS